MALSTVSQESLEIAERLKLSDRFKITNRLICGSVITLFSWILLLISFASPYWLSSYRHTFSSFIRLGLWDFCFHDYRHPYYHFDDKLTGCYWIYSHTYYNIRDWLAPDWFIFVQTMIVLAFICSTLTLILLSTLLMYYLTKYQVSLMIAISSLLIATAFTIFLGITTFGFRAFDRNWLMLPNFNHLDWSYYVALASLIFFVIAIILLILETQEIRERKKKLNNLIYNMQPRTMSTINDEKVAAQTDDHIDNAESGGVSKLQQHQQQQRNNISIEIDTSALTSPDDLVSLSEFFESVSVVAAEPFLKEVSRAAGEVGRQSIELTNEKNDLIAEKLELNQEISRLSNHNEELISELAYTNHENDLLSDEIRSLRHN